MRFLFVFGSDGSRSVSFSSYIGERWDDVRAPDPFLGKNICVTVRSIDLV